LLERSSFCLLFLTVFFVDVRRQSGTVLSFLSSGLVILLDTGILELISQLLLADGLRIVNEEVRVVVRRADVSDTLVSLLDKFFEEQVVSSTDVVVLVRLDAFLSVLFIDLVNRLHCVKDIGINRYGVNSDLDPLEVGFAGHDVEPGVLPNLLDGVSLLRVCVQDALEKILGFV